MDKVQGWRFDTLQQHAGHRSDPVTGAMALPIYQTSAYEFPSVDYAAKLFSLEESGNIYTRIMNPTNAAFEERINALEGGVGALATSSGHAALVLLLLNICRAGDNIVSSSALYGGTFNLLKNTLPAYGITAKFVNPDDPQAFADAIDGQTRALLVETIGNPGINLVDMEALAAVAHGNGVPLLVDNTFATPYLYRPIEHGADIVFHSATKYLGGHGTTMGGVLIDGGKFDWTQGRFPMMTTPDPAYHDAVYAELFGAAAFIGKARVHMMRDLGVCQSPFNAFLLAQGLQTLSLRLERHCRSTEHIADFLSAHPQVNWVKYPYLPGDRYHALYRRDLPLGVGGIFAFGIKGGTKAGAKFMDALRLFMNVANVADTRSLVIHPASTTHAQLSEEEQAAAGLSPDLVRVSVGLEDVRDLIDDLEQALACAAQC